MYKKIKNNKGFTIIEVMIVLAIAALILIIVLLAVPALQRNSKNTTAKNDASTIASAMTDFEGQNDGRIPTAPPTAFTTPPNLVVNSSVAGSTPVTQKLSGGLTSANLSFVAAAPTTLATGSIAIVFGQECPPSANFSPASGHAVISAVGIPTNATAVAVIYTTILSGGTTTGGCIQG